MFEWLKKKKSKPEEKDQKDTREVVRVNATKDLLTKILKQGFVTTEMDLCIDAVLRILRSELSVKHTTLLVQMSDGWYTILSSNALGAITSRAYERYYNMQIKEMQARGIRVYVKQGYIPEEILVRRKVEYSGIVLLEGAVIIMEDEIVPSLDLYGEVFDILSLIVRHLLQIENLVSKISIDQLTGVYNRGYLEKKLAAELRWQRQKEGVVGHVIMLDIDHFKKFNDVYGHQVGDDVLKGMSQYIKAELGTHSWIARYGGEEFLIFIGQSTTSRVIEKANRLREGIAKLRIVEGTQVTVSMGVSMLKTTVVDAVKEADTALYEAKEGGRNQVRLYVAEQVPRE